MKFRTEIEIPRSKFEITHKDRIVMLGSCFTDNIGEQLHRDGFNVVHNPMGPLYNSSSIENCICNNSINKILQDDARIWHCLDFYTKYSHPDLSTLKNKVSEDVSNLNNDLSEATIVILTLGTAWGFFLGDECIGNCHKFPAKIFERRFLSDTTIEKSLQHIMQTLGENKKYIFTVSPIRHTADGLHGNQLSKAALLIGIEKAIRDTHFQCEYFPAYEIMIDDLRDYRFYATDMKHPSETAIEYIYEKFTEVYFSTETKIQAKEARSEWKRANHRQILQ